ncbi:sensor histidine kinase [Nannocystis pusilla]|uniref:sensor histidine kinase n=1 Tax=Nannocystis pusilla TaxID=889268 RepID=UPI003DA48C30
MMDTRDEPPALARAWLWSVTWLWWTVDGLATLGQYHFMQATAGRPTAWEHALLTSMASAWLWVPLTLAIVWLTERFPLGRERLASRLIAHGAGALFVVSARAGAVWILDPWIGWYGSLPPFRVVLLQSLLNNFMLYWMIVGVAHAGLYARRERRRATEAAQLSAQLAEAQLAALKAQLHPHFLFNALGSISELVHLDPDGADRMLVKLSALLRRALNVASTQEVTLAEELSFLQPYLEIEQVRFADRLTVRWDIDPQARAALVPHLALQPLLENAIVHGIAPRAGGGTVEVAARVVGERLVLAVRDDGVGSAARVRAGVGVGLTNTRARLERLYGAAHRFAVGDVAGGGVAVEFELPLRRSAGGAP